VAASAISTVVAQTEFPDLIPFRPVIDDTFLTAAPIDLIRRGVARYELQYAISTGPFGPNSPQGIDIPLIFEHVDTNFAEAVFGYSADDLLMARRVHTAWISFIKSGSIEEGLRASADVAAIRRPQR
jgi:hypothetical protein